MSDKLSTPRDPKKYLYDIKGACELINEFAGRSTLDEYVRDKKAISACLMQFVVIGEALARLRKEAPDIFILIVDGDRIVDFRNIIAHGYDAIVDEVVWDIIHIKVPVLLREVGAILDKGCP